MHLFSAALLLALAVAAAQHPPTAGTVNPEWQPDFHTHYNNTGVFAWGTLESTMFLFRQRHYMMEGIGACRFWQNTSGGSPLDPAFAGHSYVRITEFDSGRVVVNIPGSAGFGFPSAVVDHDHDRLWVFATPHDRCDNATMNTTLGVYAWSSEDLLTWKGPTLAEGTEKLQVPNMGVGRVRMTAADAASRGLPPHRFVMILESAQLLLNDDANHDLTTGWATTALQITNHSGHSVGCPSIRYGSDGYYYAATGMGYWNGVARSRDLKNWTYGQGTGDGQLSGVMSRPGWSDGMIGPYNEWFAANAPADFYLNANESNLPIWDGNSNDPDVCCGDALFESHPAWIVYGSSSQGRTYVNDDGQKVGGASNILGVYDGTLTQFLASYFD